MNNVDVKLIDDLIDTTTHMGDIELPNVHSECVDATRFSDDPDVHRVSQIDVPTPTMVQSSPTHIFTNRHLFITSLISWYTW